MNTCTICNNDTVFIDNIDFNKSSIGIHGGGSDILIEYRRCPYCGFVYTPTMYDWGDSKLGYYVYNDDYAIIDPDHEYTRPFTNACFINNKLLKYLPNITHFDYGGGKGLLSKTLQSNGWNSISYDKYYDSIELTSLYSEYNLITAFEVFEHCIDIHATMIELLHRLSPTGVILFSTLINDKNISIPLEWWYACPRNGHVSLFSTTSLHVLATYYNLNYEKINNNLHMFYKNKPDWANLLA